MKRHVAFLTAAMAGLIFHSPLMAADAPAIDSPSGLPSRDGPELVWTATEVAPPAGIDQRLFGNSAAISGGHAFLATPWRVLNGRQGVSVSVYRKTGGSWTEQQVLEPSQPRDGGTFGTTMAMRGPMAVIADSGWFSGANRVADPQPESQLLGGSEPPAVYVFKEAGGIWSEAARLTADDGAPGAPGVPYTTFGYAVSVDASTVAVGAWGHAVESDRPNQGAVYVYSDDGNGWRQTQKVVADDRRSGDQFGFSVAVQGDTMLVGAKNLTWRRDIQLQGAVYVYVRNNGVWTQTQKLYAPDAPLAAMFGQSISLEGDTAFVGAYSGGTGQGNGAAFVLTRANGMWSVGQKLTAQSGELFDTFGGKVALSGNRAVVSAHNSWVNGTVQAGADYVFEKIGDTWVHQARLVSPTYDAYKFFGYHVAIEGRTIFSSQWTDGQAYVFEGHQPATANITPGEVSVALDPSASRQVALQIANPGDEALDFELAGSVDAGAIELAPRAATARLEPWPVTDLGQSTLTQSPLGRSVQGSSDIGFGGAPLSFILDDGSYENRLTIALGADEQSTIWLNRFAAPTGTGAFTLDSLSIQFPLQEIGSLVGSEVNLLAYYDADSDGDPRNAVRLGADHFVTIGTDSEFSTFPVDFRVPGDGDIYVGFENSYARGGTWPLFNPAAIDTAAPLPGYSWLASTVDTRWPNLADLSDHVIQGFVEDFGVRGNWLIRATGADPANDCIAPSAVPWLAVSPASGSVPAGGSAEAILTLNASGLAEGTYSAKLCAATNDPSSPMVRVPVTLTVQPDGTIFRDGFEGTP